MSELAKKIDDLGTAWEQYKSANDERVKHLEEQGFEASEHREKLERIEAEITSIEAEITSIEEIKSRLEKAEIKLDTPEFGKSGDDKLAMRHKEAFEGWVRSVKMGDKTGDMDASNRLREVESEVRREKAVSIGSANAGGHAVPEVISRMIDKKLLDISEMLPLVKVVTVGTSDYKELVDVRGSSGGWVGEGDARSETNTPSLQQVAPTFGIVYAYPKATEESLQDIFFDVQSWLVDAAVDDFDKLLGQAIISGNGTNKPTGFLNGSPESTDDDGASPERPFGTIQYVPTGVAGALPNPYDPNASPQAGVQGDFLIDTIHKLKKGYRRNARWLMNKAVMGEVRKFRDADGNYIWRPGLEAGAPSQLLGYPLSEMEDMPDIGSNTFPIAFGDFRAGYTFCNRVGTSMTIDDNITTPGYVKFYIRRRVGGILRNDDAIKVVKCAAS